MLRRLPFLCFLLVSTLHAQPSPAPAQAPVSADDTRPTFTAIAWLDSIGDLGLKPTKGQPFAPLAISTGSRSTPYPLAGKTIDLFRQVVGENGPELSPVISVPIPPDVRTPLLVLFADRVSTLGNQIDPATINYRAWIVEDSLEKFPRDTAQFVNFTPHEVLARYGNSDARITSRSHTVIRPVSPDSRSVRLQVAAKEAATGDLHYLINAPLRRVPGQRILAFLHLTDANVLEPRFIYDTPPPLETKP